MIARGEKWESQTIPRWALTRRAHLALGTAGRGALPKLKEPGVGGTGSRPVSRRRRLGAVSAKPFEGRPIHRVLLQQTPVASDFRGQRFSSKTPGRIRAAGIIFVVPGTSRSAIRDP